MSEESPPIPQRQPLTVLPDPQQEAALKALTELQSAKSLEPPKPAAAPSGTPLTSLEKKLLEGKVIKAVRQIYDPEIPVNIHDLGLIYSIEVDDTAGVKVTMTLTAPACPVAGSLRARSRSGSRRSPRCAAPMSSWSGSPHGRRTACRSWRV